MNGWYDGAGGVANTATPRAGKGMHSIAVTPGFGIKVATPGLPLTGANLFLDANSPRNEDATPQDKKTAGSENRRRPLERSTDYFSSTTTTSPTSFNSSAAHERATQSTSLEEAATQSAAEPEKETPSKEGGALFGKKLRMAFGLKKSLKLSTSDSAKAAASDDKAEDSDSKSSQNEDHAFEDNFLGRIQRIRHKYREQVQQGARSLVPNITPSLPNETPVLKPPANTTILIQEEQPDQGGIADLFEGTVKTVGQQADLIEKVAPTWLADLLLCVSGLVLFSQLNLLTALRIKCRSKTSPRYTLYSNHIRHPFPRYLLRGKSPRIRRESQNTE